MTEGVSEQWLQPFPYKSEKCVPLPYGKDVRECEQNARVQVQIAQDGRIKGEVLNFSLGELMLGGESVWEGVKRGWARCY